MSAGLRWDGATVSLGGRRVLDGIDLALGPGELVALVGRNGAGKSTLLHAALALVPCVAGGVTLDGDPVGVLSGRERAARAAWLPQQALVTEPLRAVELVAAARFRFSESGSDSRAAARAALARIGADALADRRVTELSGGEQQRVAVAALLAQDAPLLLLDEPANHLDPAHQVEVYRLLGQLWRDGLGLAVVAHDVNLLSHAVTEEESERVRVVGLAGGRLGFQQRLSAPDLPDRLGELFEARVRGVEVDGRRRFVTVGGAP